MKPGDGTGNQEFLEKYVAASSAPCQGSPIQVFRSATNYPVEKTWLFHRKGMPSLYFYHWNAN
jgi:hypothetical protein